VLPEIQSELEAIRDEDDDGVLRPEVIVDRAANPKSPLHNQFTWEDTKAAHEYRLWQARTLIRIWVRFEPRLNKPMRVMVSMQEDRERPGGGYRSLDVVMRSPDKRTALLQQAFMDFERFQAKYALLTELSEVFSAAKKAKRKAKGARQGATA